MAIDPSELARLKLVAETKLHYLKRASGIVSGLMSVRPEQVLALIAEVERLRRLTLAVKAPCHQCGDSLAKCVATMCCVGCNHATKTGDADGR